MAGSTSKGLPFIAANGETYVEIFEDTSSKTLDPRRTLQLVCGPPGSEAPPIRLIGTPLINLGPAVRSFDEIEVFFDEQRNSLTDSSNSHGLDASEANNRIRYIALYRDTLVDHMRNKMAMPGTADLRRDNKDNKFQFSDFVTLIIAHYIHWHKCMINGDLSKLCDDFDQAFTHHDKLLSSNGNRMHPSQSWSAVGVYFGMRCPTPACRMVGMCEEFCIQCKRYPWVSISFTKPDTDYKHYTDWCRSAAGKAVPSGTNKRAAYKAATGKEVLNRQATAPTIFSNDALKEICSHQDLIGLPRGLRTRGC